jgi:hypothetical protein
MVSNIDAHFFHHGHGQRVDRRRVGSGGKSLYPAGQIMVDQGLGHLAAGAIFRTDKKNPFHGCSISLRLGE